MQQNKVSSGKVCLSSLCLEGKVSESCAVCAQLPPFQLFNRSVVCYFLIFLKLNYLLLDHVAMRPWNMENRNVQSWKTARGILCPSGWLLAHWPSGTRHHPTSWGFFLWAFQQLWQRLQAPELLLHGCAGHSDTWSGELASVHHGFHSCVRFF